MALVKLAKINENSFWAAWKIEEPVNTLIQECHLAEDDLQEWCAIHHPVKQAEWLGSRAALMAILRTMDLPPQPTYKDDKGKPFLRGSAYHISLANSYPYGVAVLHRYHTVGIDIERPSDKLQRIQRKFLNSSEIEAVSNRSAYLCVYWCTKESLYKLYGRKQLSLKDNIVVHSVQWEDTVQVRATINIDQRSTLYHLQGTIIDGFFVVYSVV